MGDKLSIDRRDASRGYTEENLQIGSLFINTAKGDQSWAPSWAIAQLERRLDAAARRSVRAAT